MHAPFPMPKRSKRQSKRKKCSTKYCRNERAVRPNGRPYGGKCHKCRSRIWRQNNPLRAYFNTLKAHAASRDLEFHISFEYFRCFCRIYSLVESTGRDGDSLTIDRDNNLFGYIPGNLRVLTRSENTAKRNRCDEIRMRHGLSWRRF